MAAAAAAGTLNPFPLVAGEEASMPAARRAPGWRRLCWLLALWSVALWLPARGCPTKCTCSGPNVDCHGLGFKTVPRGIPRNAERL